MILIQRIKGRYPLMAGVGMESLKAIVEAKRKERLVNAIAGVVLLLGLTGIAILLILGSKG